jgi:hypothetical protein
MVAVCKRWAVFLDCPYHSYDYRNLRPIFIADNLSKGAKLPDDYVEHIEMIKKHLAVSQD